MKKILLFILISSHCVFGQNTDVVDQLIGNWEGALIKNNSYQKIEIEFFLKNDQVAGLLVMEEWHPTFGEFEIPVTIDSLGQISFSAGYGKAILKLDANNLELVGQLPGFNPAIYIHFKKVPPPPPTNYQVEEVYISSGMDSLYGHLHLPGYGKKKTAVIIVGGRGCYPDQTKYNLYAKFFRKYGVTVLAYQKRGTGKSTGDCSIATIQDLANDLQRVRQYLADHPNQYENIGVLGISAGGWTMTKAEETTDFDFMISIVGPATSVRDQQLQSMEYGSAVYQLDDKAKTSLAKYTRLMFDAPATKEGYEQMMDVLALAEKEGWKELLEDTDVPSPATEMKNLWVRRHNYDPKAVLSQYDRPFLAIYGERDFIVPPRENIAALNNYFSTQPENLSTVVAFNAEHGMEMEAKWIDLGRDQSYWHFYRISPRVRIELANFLVRHQLIDQ